MLMLHPEPLVAEESWRSYISTFKDRGERRGLRWEWQRDGEVITADGARKMSAANWNV